MFVKMYSFDVVSDKESELLHVMCVHVCTCTPCEVRLLSRAEGSKFVRLERGGRGVVDEIDGGRGCCCCWILDRVSAILVSRLLKDVVVVCIQSVCVCVCGCIYTWTQCMSVQHKHIHNIHKHDIKYTLHLTFPP